MRSLEDALGRRRRSAWQALVVAAIGVVAALMLSTSSAPRRASTPTPQRRVRTVRTAATVPYASAGPSCVNVWMGGNPNDPNACRPAPPGR